MRSSASVRTDRLVGHDEHAGRLELRSSFSKPCKTRFWYSASGSPRGKSNPGTLSCQSLEEDGIREPRSPSAVSPSQSAEVHLPEVGAPGCGSAHRPPGSPAACQARRKRARDDRPRRPHWPAGAPPGAHVRRDPPRRARTSLLPWYRMLDSPSVSPWRTRTTCDEASVMGLLLKKPGRAGGSRGGRAPESMRAAGMPIGGNWRAFVRMRPRKALLGGSSELSNTPGRLAGAPRSFSRAP